MEIKIGISSCLLGEKVRYDGQHKLDRYLTDHLGAYVKYVPVCPEVECGLPVPREAMRLVGSPEIHRLITIRTLTDHTTRMQTWSRQRLDKLAKEDLCGYVFKAKSPSSGMRDTKIYSEKGTVVAKGAGLFARAFMDRFPLIPVEDEGRLHDDGIRENFIERVMAFARWKEFVNSDGTLGGLVNFHTGHKLLVMAHSVVLARELGCIVGNAKGKPIAKVRETYLTTFLNALAKMATVKKQVNVLQHCAGYFKQVLDSEEKLELQEVIERYHRELVPLIVPVTLIAHYVRKFNEPFLKRQYYLHPHPVELKLRNHV